MVYGIVIHTLTSSKHLLFSAFYTPEGNDRSKKERLEQIIQAVIEDYSFKTQCAANVAEIKKKYHDSESDWKAKFLKWESRIFSADSELWHGVIHVAPSNLLETPKLILWRTLNEAVITLVCETFENLHLAFYFVYKFPHVLADTENKEISQKVLFNKCERAQEEILALLDFWLPGGHLQLANSELVKYFRKESLKLLNNPINVNSDTIQ